jgi:carbon monoxide dehydrogenase subunit G
VKVSGQATLRGPVERVYRALNDPGVLVRTIPGCQRLELIGPDAYRMTLTAGVASIKGTYVGDVRLTDQDAPHAFTMRAAGSGAPGTVSADVKVTLTDPGDGTTLLVYDADAVVGGMIGGVGQRMLTGVARKTAGEFFAAVDEVLAGATAGREREGAAPEAEVDPSVEARRTAVLRAAGGTDPMVFTRAAAPVTGRAMPAGFLAGVLVGAAVALAGAVVGGLLAGRRRG